LRQLIDETGADAVFWSRCYEPDSIARDTHVKSSLKDDGVRAESFPGLLLAEPWEARTKQGGPFQVFTPFWKSIRERLPDGDPLPAPQNFKTLSQWPDSEPIESLGLEPRIAWASEMEKFWTPGCLGAKERLREFLKQAIIEYAEARDRPDGDHTSRLSPHLHFGEISPRRIWRDALRAAGVENGGKPWPRGLEVFLKEVGWREFAYHLLYHFPQTTNQPLREAFRAFPWENDPEAERAWQKGRTGFPIVDAGMRQLWALGWMHNRVRMIVASFLTKDLRVSWTAGAKWFWDTLVDADLASNTLGWQWTAGCGADAAPYFRVFNPTLQSEKFDPNGGYIRSWVPELRRLSDRWIHAPWLAPADELRKAGVTLGETYPAPLVDHGEARQRALDAFARIKAE